MRTIEEYEKLLWEKYQQSNNPEIEERYLHSLSVKKKALEISDTFNLNVDREKAALAAVLHDYAKFDTLERFKEIISKYHLNEEILKCPQTLHSILGPYIIKEELGLKDQEILEAIENHALGSLEMSKLGEVLFLADFTEENREGPVFTEAKQLSKIDFYQAILAKIKCKLETYPDELSSKLYQKYQEVQCKS